MKATIYSFVFFVIWSIFTIVINFNLPNPVLLNFLLPPLIFTLLMIAFQFKKSKKITLSTEIDPKLIEVSKFVLKNYLNSREKGQLISSQYLGPNLLPVMQKELSAYSSFLANGIETKSRAKNIDNLKFKLFSKGGNFKVKISGLFQHDYLYNGKVLESPTDLSRYLENSSESFYAATYTLNFKKDQSGNYQLVGYTDTVMGNKYGDL